MVIGKTIFKMDMEKKHGRMDQNMEVSIKKVKRMDKETIHGQMEVITMGVGCKIEYLGKASTNGLTEER